MDDFLQKLKKVVHIVLCGPAISQSDRSKAGLYHLAYNKLSYCLKGPFNLYEDTGQENGKTSDQKNSKTHF